MRWRSEACDGVRSPRLPEPPGFEIFMPHAAIVDRAEVLQVPVPGIPEREVPVGAAAA
jgi:hypothetical protein